MTCSVLWIPVNLFPQPLLSSVITQQAPEQSGHGGKIIFYARDQQHGLPLTKANLGKALLRVQSVSSKDQHWDPPDGTVPQGDQPATLETGWPHGMACIPEGAEFFFLLEKTLWIWIYLPCNTSAKTTLHELTERRIYYHALHFFLSRNSVRS